ncbi:MAG: zinc-binding dehydrogenase [Nitriliruptorales bacterium]|nr:zinc-binding dehydrogenase [Nitriliruptorales bacterium]
MRAAVLTAPGRVRIEDVATPDPGHDEVLIHVEGSGICGSDLAVYGGRPWFDYPRPAGAPGHEIWGRVTAAGPGVPDGRVGQRAVALSYNGFAEFDVAHVDHLVPFPRDHAGAFPGEAVGCAMNVFERSGIGRGDTVAVVGVGFIGALLVQRAAACGSTVIAITRRRFALDLAQRCGAKHVIGLTDDPYDVVAELTGGHMCDVVIEAAGRQSTLDLAASLVKVRGRLVVAGYHQDGARTVDMQSWNWRGIDVVNAHERDPSIYVRGMKSAVAAVTGRMLDLPALITHSVPLHDIGRAFDLALERPDGFLKAVVRP